MLSGAAAGVLMVVLVMAVQVGRAVVSRDRLQPPPSHKLGVAISAATSGLAVGTLSFAVLGFVQWGIIWEAQRGGMEYAQALGLWAACAIAALIAAMSTAEIVYNHSAKEAQMNRTVAVTKVWGRIWREVWDGATHSAEMFLRDMDADQRIGIGNRLLAAKNRVLLALIGAMALVLAPAWWQARELVLGRAALVLMALPLIGLFYATPAFLAQVVRRLSRGQWGTPNAPLLWMYPVTLTMIVYAAWIGMWAESPIPPGVAFGIVLFSTVAVSILRFSKFALQQERSALPE